MMNIVSQPSAVRSSVVSRLTGLNPAPVFTQDIFPALWDADLHYGIDPVGLVAQSFKETGAGRFTGNVTPQFYNTAGIKIRHTNIFPGTTDNDRPLAHQMFPNWEVGAAAHAQHVRAYAGRPVSGELIVDPRYVWVIGRFSLTRWSDLGGKWAPSPTYGAEIENIMRTLIS
jgi:hypothetical protein